MLQMGQRRRRHYTDTEKVAMWDRWRMGESMNEIGRFFGIQGHSSIQRIFSETGGIRPAERRRSVRCLSLSEREEISRGLMAGRSIRSIAGALRRAPDQAARLVLIVWFVRQRSFEQGLLSVSERARADSDTNCSIAKIVPWPNQTTLSVINSPPDPEIRRRE
jgi:hypothetical protein